MGVHSEAMHRLSAVLLIALSGYSLAGPAVLAADDESSLPACCRRAGKHHCAMTGGASESSAGPVLRSARCPLFPSAKVPANRIVTFAGSRPAMLWVLIGQPADHAEVRSISRICYHRPGEKRGPPHLL